MLPKMPPKTGQPGFLYVPPFRIQGVSVAGEQTMVQVPELDVAFDIGMCPRIALASPYVALSHGHMDHVGGLPYYFSQRVFQRMGIGTCVCHAALAGPISRMLDAWVELEEQRTPREIIPLEPGEHVEIKNNMFLTALEVSHTVPSLGYCVVEHRSKLREEFHNLPQQQLRELKASGTEITKTLKIPLIAYTGDTEFGPALFQDEFAQAKIVITECTFFEADHKGRASVGKHLHVDDLINLMNIWQAEAVIIVHVSRRTNLAEARQRVDELLPEEHAHRIHFLMDHRANRRRYENQQHVAAVTA